MGFGLVWFSLVCILLTFAQLPMRITEKERKKNEKVEEKGNEMCARDVRACTGTCTACAYVCVCRYVCIGVHVCACMCMCVCVCARARMYVCVRARAHVHKHTVPACAPSGARSVVI